jgi:enoyl-CoA hydratase/carnithine racemase
MDTPWAGGPRWPSPPTCESRNGGTAKIGLPEAGLGVLPGTGGTQRLVRLVGKARAIELMATGLLMSFEDAAALAIVNEVWGDDRLSGRTFVNAVIDYAKQFHASAAGERSNRLH